MSEGTKPRREPSEKAIDAALNVTPFRSFEPALPYGGEIAPCVSREEMRVILRAAYIVEDYTPVSQEPPK